MKSNTARKSVESETFDETVTYWNIDQFVPLDPKKAALQDVNSVFKKHSAALKKALEKTS